MRAVSSTAPPPPAMLPAADPPGDLPPVMPDDRHISPLQVPAPLWQTAGRWIFTKGLLLVWFILALAYAAYLLLGENRKPEPATDELNANSSAGSISPYSSQQQANPGAPAAADTHAPSATPKPRIVPQYKDVSDSLRAARASLQDNNLSDAKAAANAALAREADNDDARAMQRDIAAREQRRDSALQSADRCASERAWACVQQQSSEALAIDASSLHAQSLLERAILSTGWTPLATPGPAGTGQPASAAAPLPRGAS
ncbi:zinc ribbon domain-containing protein, partial [Paraburkholderia solisilvae]